MPEKATPVSCCISHQGNSFLVGVRWHRESPSAILFAIHYASSILCTRAHEHLVYITSLFSPHCGTFRGIEGFRLQGEVGEESAGGVSSCRNFEETEWTSLEA